MHWHILEDGVPANPARVLSKDFVRVRQILTHTDLTYRAAASSFGRSRTKMDTSDELHRADKPNDSLGTSICTLGPFHPIRPCIEPSQQVESTPPAPPPERRGILALVDYGQQNFSLLLSFNPHKLSLLSRGNGGSGAR